MCSCRNTNRKISPSFRVEIHRTRENCLKTIIHFQYKFWFAFSCLIFGWMKDWDNRIKYLYVSILLYYDWSEKLEVKGMKRNVFDLFYKMKWWAWKNDICGYNNSSIKTIFLKKEKKEKEKRRRYFNNERNKWNRKCQNNCKFSSPLWNCNTCNKKLKFF